MILNSWQAISLWITLCLLDKMTKGKSLLLASLVSWLFSYKTCKPLFLFFFFGVCLATAILHLLLSWKGSWFNYLILKLCVDSKHATGFKVVLCWSVPSSVKRWTPKMAKCLSWRSKCFYSAIAIRYLAEHLVFYIIILKYAKYTGEILFLHQ